MANFFGPLISGVGSLLSSMIGGVSQMSANDQNIKAVRETNKANMQMNQANIDAAMQMYDRQEAYNRYVYEDQKDYNSAVNQRQRLEEAGLNPYLMMSGGSAGTAGSSSAPGYSQPSMIPMQAAHVEPVLSASDLDGIGAAINQGRLTDAQIDKTKAEASSQWQDANYRDMIIKLTAAKMISEINGLDAKTRGQLIDNFVNQNSAQYHIEQAKNDADYSFQQARSMALQVATQKAQLPYVAPTAAAQLDNLVAQKLLTDKQIQVSEEQRKLIKAQTNTERAKPGMIAQQIALMIQQGKLTEKQAAKVYADTLYVNKQRFNLPNLTKEDCDKLGQAMVTSASNAAFVSEVDADKAGWYFRQPEGQKDVTNFLESAGRAILPWK